MKKRNWILKVFSLGVGLAIGCILIAKVCFESAYDSFYKDIDRIYIIKTGVSMQGEVKDFDQISGGVAPGFKQYVPGVEYATRTTFLFESDKYYTEDRRQVSGKLVLADTSFFHVFDRNILEGDPVQVLSQPRMAMVSRSFAEKMGGIDKAVGQVLYNEDASGWKFTVGGIYEDFRKTEVWITICCFPWNHMINGAGRIGWGMTVISVSSSWRRESIRLP